MTLSGLQTNEASDLSMPIMDGFEATRTIRHLEAEQNPPADTKATFIVALTGLANASDEKNAFDAGVDMYLTKPVQFSRLSALLREYTEKTLER
jgi:CheY-like chemotaxis protein